MSVFVASNQTLNIIITYFIELHKDRTALKEICEFYGWSYSWDMDTASCASRLGKAMRAANLEAFKEPHQWTHYAYEKYECCLRKEIDVFKALDCFVSQCEPVGECDDELNMWRTIRTRFAYKIVRSLESYQESQMWR